MWKMIVSGTHFEDKQHNRYSECPKCCTRLNEKKKSNSEISFKELLLASYLNN